MPLQRWPQPAEETARRYRRAHEKWDREASGAYERGGFGSPRGYRGAYTERQDYRRRRATSPPPDTPGSGWPYPLYEMPADAEERRLRAYRDRDLARSVDFALYNVLGREAERIRIYAADSVISLEGTLPHPRAARAALETACSVPGVRRVRHRLGIRRSHGRA